MMRAMLRYFNARDYDELAAERDEFKRKLDHLNEFATELTHLPEYQWVGLRMRQMIGTAPNSEALDG